jgi:tungstate transport system substrate-binding protein
VLLAAVLIGCGDRQPARIVLATTTSVQDSGLLDAILPPFTEQSGIDVSVVAVGSGQAMEIGKRGDADVLITHSPAAEKQFVAEGYAAQRIPFAHNDFVLLGPADDPASVRDADSVREALRRIAGKQAIFVSRGDDSGTHKKELSLWTDKPQGEWYLEAGAGMVQVLRIADEKSAYTLSDRGTYLASAKAHGLVMLHEGDAELVNPYSILIVKSRRRRETDALAAYLTSEACRKLIAEFGRDEFGQSLFVPDSQ